MDVEAHGVDFEAMANALPGAVCLLDRAGDITWVSDGWTRFAAANNYSGPPFIGVNYLAVCAAAQGAERADAQDVASGVLQVLRGERAFFQYTYACHSPSARQWFQLTAVKLGEATVVLHLPAIPPAVAPQMAASRLFNRIARELQSPLSTMSGYAQLIADGMAGKASDVARDYARQIFQASDRLSGIVEDMMDLTKANDKTLQLNELETPTEELVTLARALTRYEAEAQNVTVDVDLGCRGVLLCDPRRMTQVLVNLLSNAIKFSSPGSTVVIRAVPETGDGCNLEVIDQGAGIAAEDIPTVLRAFGRTAATEASDIPGLGLGLPLARVLVELHGGRLDIASQPGHGTTITIRLPRWRVVAARGQPSATP